MKIYLNYETIKQFVLAKCEEFKKENFEYIVAVSRGGITLAHIIAKELKLPIAYFFPTRKPDCVSWPDRKKNRGKILVVEDLIALGRTTKEIHQFFTNFNYKYYAFLIDGNYKDNDYDYYSIKTNDWIVFPWEDYEKMPEGDRGLFRNKTDKYGE